MKPDGPIPHVFVDDANGMWLSSGDRSDTLADAASDTPLFVYDSAMLTARVAEWRAAMPTEVQLHYAMKANPHAPLLAFMAGLVDGFDVGSGRALKTALATGMAAADIRFAGPRTRTPAPQAALSRGDTHHPYTEGEHGPRPSPAETPPS